MRPSSDRVRTTHTGSLPRPAGLTALMYEQEEGKEVDREALRAAQLEAVGRVVDEQVRAGIDVVSDGEMSKPGFLNYVTGRLTGLGGLADPWTPRDLLDFPELLQDQYGGEAGAHIVTKKCVGELDYVGHDLVQRDIADLAGALRGREDVEGFVPAASPGCIAMVSPNEYYDSYRDYLFAIAGAMRAEYRAIVESGMVLQLDCPDIPMAAHTTSGVDVAAEIGYRKLVELHVAALNEAVAGLPQDRIRVHICWGNYVGPHHLDVALAEILPPVLEATPVGLSFEAANPRHEHEWEDLVALRIPDDKILFPGVIDVKTNVLEHPRLIAQRIERFAGAVGRERVIAGTDCGFGTFVGFGTVQEQIAWRKLANLAEGARIASRHLW